MEFKSVNDLEKRFYKNKGDIVKFHFDLSNCLHLIMEDYQQGLFYFFVTKLKRNAHFAKCSQLLKKKRRMVWKD